MRIQTDPPTGSAEETRQKQLDAFKEARRAGVVLQLKDARSKIKAGENVDLDEIAVLIDKLEDR